MVFCYSVPDRQIVNYDSQGIGPASLCRGIQQTELAAQAPARRLAGSDEIVVGERGAGGDRAAQCHLLSQAKLQQAPLTNMRGRVRLAPHLAVSHAGK